MPTTTLRLGRREAERDHGDRDLGEPPFVGDARRHVPDAVPILVDVGGRKVEAPGPTLSFVEDRDDNADFDSLIKRIVHIGISISADIFDS